MVHLVKAISSKFGSFLQLCETYLLLFSKQVEYYQPLYGMYNFKKAQRVCLDRAHIIYERIKSWGHGAYILDIGCSLGYFSYFFGRKHYFVDGIDYSQKNIKICQSLQWKNEKNVNFYVENFSKDYINQIHYSRYDIAFLFSVLHHIIQANGLEYAQDLMQHLMEKIPVLFVELAIKREKTSAPWQKNLPDNELDVFAKCTDITIERLGYFPTHLSSVKRPLYLITKDSMLTSNKLYKVLNRKFLAYGGQYLPLGGRYYYCEDIFIKRYLIWVRQDNIKLGLQEIKNYQTLPKNNFFPTMFSYEVNNDKIDIVFNKLPGTNVYDLLLNGQPLPKFQLLKTTIESLKFLLYHGLYYNDVRLWNILFDGEKYYFFDLGTAQKIEEESTNFALLWMIGQLHHIEKFKIGKYPIRLPPRLALQQLQPEFREIANQLIRAQSFPEFLSWFNDRHP